MDAIFILVLLLINTRRWNPHVKSGWDTRIIVDVFGVVAYRL